MKKYIALLLLVSLSACQSTPRLEDDTRYAKLATVLDRHEFSAVEHRQARANTPSDTSIGFGVGVGTGGGDFGYGGMMTGMVGTPIDTLNSRR